MDINSLMFYIIISVAIIGVLLAVVIGVLSYKKTAADIKSGRIKLFTQTKLANTDVSISKAVENLKIVNASIDVGDSNDTV